MEPIYIAALSSFLVSAFGYVIFHFWMRPIWRYRRLKKSARTTIASYLDAINGKDEPASANANAKKTITIIRNLSGELARSFDDDLPQWYKLLLRQRKESPIDASQHMVVLANTTNYHHARNRAKRISQLLFP